MADQISSEGAAGMSLGALPEFVPYYEGSDGALLQPGDELLLHVVMGDLARFYMERGLVSQELAGRFWSVVETLAAEGDQWVENAVHVSLIEWFAWGDEREQAALGDAAPLHGPATKAVVAYYR